MFNIQQKCKKFSLIQINVFVSFVSGSDVKPWTSNGNRFVSSFCLNVFLLFLSSLSLFSLFLVSPNSAITQATNTDRCQTLWSQLARRQKWKRGSKKERDTKNWKSYLCKKHSQRKQSSLNLSSPFALHFFVLARFWSTFNVCPLGV